MSDALTGSTITFVLNGTVSASEASTPSSGEDLQFAPADVQVLAMNTSLGELFELVNVARFVDVTRKSSVPSPFVSMSMRTGACAGVVHGPNVATAK